MAGTVNPASLTQPPLGRKLSLTRVPDRSSFARVCKLNNQIHRCLARFSKSVLTLGLKLLHSGPIVAKENSKFLFVKSIDLNSAIRKLWQIEEVLLQYMVTSYDFGHRLIRLSYKIRKLF